MFFKMFFIGVFTFLFLKWFIYPSMPVDVNRTILDILFGSVVYIIFYLKDKQKNK